MLNAEKQAALVRLYSDVWKGNLTGDLWLGKLLWSLGPVAALVKASLWD